MSRAMQNVLMVLVGGAVLWITLITGEVVNFVKPGLRWPLAIAALVLVVLGLAGVRRDWHEKPDEPESDGQGEPGLDKPDKPDKLDKPDGHDGHDGHEHGHDKPDGHGHGEHWRGEHERGEHGHEGHGHGSGGPRVAWLLCLPVLAIFAIAPPALGVFTASRADEARQAAPPQIEVKEDDYALPPGPDPLPMTIGEFMGRSFEAQIGGQVTLTGRRLKLTGFVTPRKEGGWYLTRLQMNCCAADSMALRVRVLDAPAPAKGSWVEAVGVWHPAEMREGHAVYEFTAESVSPVEKPDNPYE